MSESDGSTINRQAGERVDSIIISISMSESDDGTINKHA
jgi:hypothetical protein